MTVHLGNNVSVRPVASAGPRELVRGCQRSVHVGEAVVEQQRPRVPAAGLDHGDGPVHQLGGERGQVDGLLHNCVVFCHTINEGSRSLVTWSSISPRMKLLRNFSMRSDLAHQLALVIRKCSRKNQEPNMIKNIKLKKVFLPTTNL